MKIPISRQSGDIGVNMTPMIDVVFQLLIFFLVSSHLAKQEAQMKLPLPEASSGQRSVENSGPRLTINVLADERLLLAGRPVSIAELPDRLKNAVLEEGKDLEVRIRGDRSVPYRVIEPLLLHCARAGIWKVAFAVYPAKESN